MGHILTPKMHFFFTFLGVEKTGGVELKKRGELTGFSLTLSSWVPGPSLLPPLDLFLHYGH